MKERLSRRRKRFWALLLAVLLGMLPTAEVWAQTYVLVNNHVDGDECGYSLNYGLKINGKEISNATLSENSSGSVDIVFYALSTDVIECASGTDDNTFFSNDNDDDEEAHDTGNSFPSWENSQLALKTPGEIWAACNVFNGWQVKAVCVSDGGQHGDGYISKIVITPVNVIKINYIHAGSRAGSGNVADSDNTNVSCVPDVKNGDPPVVVQFNNLTNISGHNFSNWFIKDINEDSVTLTGIEAYHASGDDYSKIQTNGGSATGTDIPIHRTLGEVPSIDLYANWTSKPAPYYPPAPEPTPEPITYTVNFDPNNSIEENQPETVSTT